MNMYELYIRDFKNLGKMLLNSKHRYNTLTFYMFKNLPRQR